MAASGPLIVDVHTHMYPESYMNLLRSRTSVPYVYDPPTGDPRLIILSSDDSAATPKHLRGRPVGAEYWNVESKLAFMKHHGISSSIVSLANPWLDFVESDKALEFAERINTDMNEMCASVASRPTFASAKVAPLYSFGTLPLSGPPDAIVSEINRLKTLKYMRGIIMGTSGLGAGLDDAALDPVFAALEQTDSMIFLHPHYGLPSEAFGKGSNAADRYGHVLPLALGFPLETTIAVARMYLSGVFDKFPKIKFLLAHSGGTLPFLAGRIESCVEHERHFYDEQNVRSKGPQRSIWEVLSSNIWLDAVIYGAPGLKAAVTSQGEKGWERLMFGTDHPFFPPLVRKKETADIGEEDWLSVSTNTEAIRKVFGGESVEEEGVLGANAVKVLGLN